MAKKHDWLQVHEQATVKYLGTKADDSPMPPPPQVPSNVTEVGLPAMSASVDVDGTTLDYLPIAFYVTNLDRPIQFEKPYYPFIGIMTPDGNVVQSYKITDNTPGRLACIFMADPKSELGIGTSIKQTLHWVRLSQSWIPAETPHTTSVSVTSGITETEGESLSFSIGARIGFSKVITAELSSALTKSFNQQVSIIDQTTVAEQFTFPEKQTQQVVGVYQVNKTFSIYAGANLANFVAEYNTSDWGYYFTVKAETPSTYSMPSYMQIAGTDSPSELETKHMLSSEAMEALVKRSVYIRPVR
jgi:hypothetical protein